MKINCWLNSFIKEKDGVQNIFVKTKEFSYKNCAVSSVGDLLRKIDTMNSLSLKAGSGRPRTIRTEQNINCVAELIYSQEDNPESNKSPRDIEKLTGISRSSVRRVVGLDDLKERMCTCWSSLDQQLISKAVDQWRLQLNLKAVVQVHGRHIEQLFTWLSGCCTLSLLGCRHNYALLLCFAIVIYWCWVLWLCCNFFEQPVDILIWFGLQYV